MAWFAPNMAFNPQEVSAAMCGLLLFDLAAEHSVANPATELMNPTDMFFGTAFHGGGVRAAFQGDSTGTLSFLLGKAGYKRTPNAEGKIV